MKVQVLQEAENHGFYIFGIITNPLSSCWPTSILLEMNQTSQVFPNPTPAPVNAAAIVSNAAPKFSQALKMHLQKRNVKNPTKISL